MYAFFISLVSGYPVGAKITRDLFNNGYIDTKQATRTALLSSTSGASFIIGTIGTVMLGNVKYGIIIYLSNFIAVLIYSILFNLISKNRFTDQTKESVTFDQKKEPFLKIISSSVIDTIKGILIVAFYITLFSLIIELFNTLILAKLPNISITTKSVMSGIIEMTTGAKGLSIVNSNFSIPLIAMLTGFSGISIIMQSVEFLNNTKVKAYKFFIAKCFHAVFSFFICLLLLKVFNI